MPDASGRFRGISIPVVPWHRQLGEAADRLDPGGQTMIRDGEDYQADQIAAANRQTFGPARQHLGSTPTDTTRE